MIIYVYIVRTNDSLPLAASTDFNHETNRNVKENKQYVKIVAKKAPFLVERCYLNINETAIYMITCYGISYIVMVEQQYPACLAFHFLNELLREFANKYEVSKINEARRPYHFIEFDTVIHKMRLMYNNPHSLLNRVNIKDLNTELSLKPPYRIDLNLPKMVPTLPRMEPIPWYSWVSTIFASLLIILGFIRGFAAIHHSGTMQQEVSSLTHGFIYILEALVRTYQIYLLFFHVKFKILQCWLVVILLIGCILLLWDMRNPKQHSVFALSAIMSHICIATRKFRQKFPDHDV